ncbi:MAG: hypothetical protein IBX52_13200, partial [Bacterioplanes sp.]|nr:hypothetical protein [Bacterioplanes sp.]
RAYADAGENWQLFRPSLAIAAAMSFSVPAQADIMVGIGLGSFSLESGSRDLGSNSYSRLSLEFIDNETKSAVGIRTAYSDFGKFKGDVELSHIGIDLTYRNRVVENGDLIVTAGLGRMNVTEPLYTQWATIKADYTKLSGQGSIGYRHHFGQLSVQADYSLVSVLDSKYDIKLSGLTVGANYAF